MQLIYQKEKNGMVYDDYGSNLFEDPAFGLKLMGIATNYSNIIARSIDICDGYNCDEGSVSTVMDRIDSIDGFVKRYQFENLEYISTKGTYKKYNILIVVYLREGFIRIGYSKRYNFSSKDLANKLELLAAQI